MPQTRQMLFPALALQVHIHEGSCTIVSREMFTIFFEDAYQKLFDGCTLLTPVVYPGVEICALETFGFIISYHLGFYQLGWLPNFSQLLAGLNCANFR